MLASWCVILYSMMILKCWRRCYSVGRCRCCSIVVTLAYSISIVVVHDVSGGAALYFFKFVDIGGCMWIPDVAGIF